MAESGKKLINLNVKVIKASGFFEKMTGLIFKKLKENEIFLMNNCNGIHTLWMTRPIDVIFLNENNEVAALYENFGIFRFTCFIKSAVRVIEAEAGFIEKTEICLNDIIVF